MSLMFKLKKSTHLSSFKCQIEEANKILQRKEHKCKNRAPSVIFDEYVPFLMT